jgi:hypothetical protein
MIRAMRLLCLIFGHRWDTFTAEQCPEVYRMCLRCDLIQHVCNEIDWSRTADRAQPS